MVMSYEIRAKCIISVINYNNMLLSGVSIFEGVRLEGVDVEGGRVTGVKTNKGNISCEIFVNCAGQVCKKSWYMYEPIHVGTMYSHS